MIRPAVLLNPGPVTLTERVRQALLRPDQCHREPEFAALTQEIRSRLVRVYDVADSDFEAVVLTGSGTCAVEAMLASFAPATSRTLVLINGVYGQRMADMLRAQGKPLVTIESDWLAGIDLATAERRLASDPTISHVAAVHHETTTGRLNDIAALGQLCRHAGRSLMLDAVSSFGGEQIDFESWNLLAVAATANKCLHGAPGAAFTLARRDALDAGQSYSQSLYLDLYRYYREQRTGYSPFTQAVQIFFALHEALEELEDTGGWKARRDRYHELSGAVGDLLTEQGVEYLLPAAARASMLTAFRLPPGLSYDKLHDRMRDAGFVIYAGQGPLRDTIFRIATMGDIQRPDLDRLGRAISTIFAEL
jgi:2-aminoethylphosphonate-pyruvate transaminase